MCGLMLVHSSTDCVLALAYDFVQLSGRYGERGM